MRSIQAARDRINVFLEDGESFLIFVFVVNDDVNLVALLDAVRDHRIRSGHRKNGFLKKNSPLVILDLIIRVFRLRDRAKRDMSVFVADLDAHLLAALGEVAMAQVIKRAPCRLQFAVALKLVGLGVEKSPDGFWVAINRSSRSLQMQFTAVERAVVSGKLRALTADLRLVVADGEAGFVPLDQEIKFPLAVGIVND